MFLIFFLRLVRNSQLVWSLSTKRPESLGNQETSLIAIWMNWIRYVSFKPSVFKMRDKEIQNQNDPSFLSREVMMAPPFVRIDSSCLFSIFTLLGPTLRPTPCSQASFTSWPTHMYKVAYVLRLLLIYLFFHYVWYAVLLIVWHSSESFFIYYSLLFFSTYPSVWLSIRAMSAGDRPGFGKEGSCQLRR